MSLMKPQKKTPREWSREWLVRANMAGAEASSSDVVEVIVMEAVAYERKRCALVAEGHKAGRCRSDSCCGKGIAEGIRKP